MTGMSEPSLYDVRQWAFVNEEIPDKELVEKLGLTQPAWLTGINFKAPQTLAFHYGARNPFFVLGLDKGMGKTITYLSVAAEHIRPDLAYASGERPKKLVILCSTNAMHTQRVHLRKYFPDWADRAAFIRGQAATRRNRWAKGWDVVITTPAGWRADCAAGMVPLEYRRGFVIIDEHHKVLRTRKSQFFELMKKQRADLLGLILSSGSAGGKGPQDVWAALRVVAPASFGSYWNYVYEYCVVDEGRWGKMIGPVKNIGAWRRKVAPALFARKKRGEDYPPKTRQTLDYEMEPWQKKIHDKLRTELVAEIPSGMLITPNVLAATMALRRFMVCPKAVDEELGWGGALEAILADFQEAELTHAVVSCFFKSPIPHMETFMQKVGGLWTERLMGQDGIDPNEMARRIGRWTDKGGIMFQTIDFATSYELPAANFMYMNSYKYDPEDNSQAEDRINRDISVTPLPSHIYYMRARNSFDYKVLEALSDNADNQYNMMHRPMSEVFQLFDEDPETM